MRILTHPLVPVASLVVGVVAGFLLGGLMPDAWSPKGGTEVHTNSGAFEHVNPLLLCGGIDGVLPRELKAMEAEVNEYVASVEAESVTTVGVYFRDLNNGPAFGVHQELMFAPGSLLKVPIMMAILKRSETEPALLEKQVTYTPMEELQIIAPSVRLEAGGTYSVGELMKAMITRSDNGAAAALYDQMDEDLIDRTYEELGLAPPQDGEDYNISVRDYASFFRLLYNATYLEPETSEQALALLTQSEFKKGLVAGVPERIQVAHKFGEREDGNTFQLHDCGVVYVPGHPYVLCVMTRGQNIDNLKKVISTISKTVYTHIN